MGENKKEKNQVNKKKRKTVLKEALKLESRDKLKIVNGSFNSLKQNRKIKVDHLDLMVEASLVTKK